MSGADKGKREKYLSVFEYLFCIQGKTISEISEMIGVSVPTLNKWRRENPQWEELHKVAAGAGGFSGAVDEAALESVRALKHRHRQVISALSRAETILKKILDIRRAMPDIAVEGGSKNAD